jgi:hypothetical protein
MFKVRCTHKNGQISVKITGANTATSAKQALEWSIRKYRKFLKMAEKYPKAEWEHWAGIGDNSCPLCRHYPDWMRNGCAGCPLENSGSRCVDNPKSPYSRMSQLYPRPKGFQIMLAALIKARKFVEDK